MHNETKCYLLGATVFLTGLISMYFLNNHYSKIGQERDREKMKIYQGTAVRKESQIIKIDSNFSPLELSVRWYDNRSNLLKEVREKLPSERGNRRALEIINGSGEN